MCVNGELLLVVQIDRNNSMGFSYNMAANSRPTNQIQRRPNSINCSNQFNKISRIQQLQNIRHCHGIIMAMVLPHNHHTITTKIRERTWTQHHSDVFVCFFVVVALLKLFSLLARLWYERRYTYILFCCCRDLLPLNLYQNFINFLDKKVYNIKNIIAIASKYPVCVMLTKQPLNC